MNVLLRHTLACVTRNPVQSLIVAISTAMITACVLMCLCLSSLFEQISMLKAGSYYGGADLYIFVPAQHSEAVHGYVSSHESEVEAYYLSYSTDTRIETETETVRCHMISVLDIDEFDRLTNADILSRGEGLSGHIPAHVSAAFAETTGVGIGDVFENADGRKFVVTAIADNTARYFLAQYVVFACETDDLEPNWIFVYLRDPKSLRADGSTVIDSWKREIDALAEEPVTMTNGEKVVVDAMETVTESMTLLSIAAAAITIIMGALLYTSFSVIVRGRVDELVKFKAAGATPAQSVGILLFEALFYALAGGAVGLGVGKALIDVMSGLLGQNIVNGIITVAAWKYPVALLIGTACALAACAGPAVRMSAYPVRRLLAGENRSVRSVHPIVAAALTLFTAAGCIAVFMVPRTVTVPVAAVTLVLSVLWLIVVMPLLLKGICRLAQMPLQRGAPAIAVCTTPRNAAVSSAFVMLAALIMFIRLGMGILDIVGYTSVAYTERYNSDFVVSLWGAGQRDPEAQLELCLDTEGITDGAYVHSYTANGLFIGDENGNKLTVRETETTIYNDICAVGSGKDLGFVTSDIDPAVVKAFDETEDPMVVSAYLAYKYDIKAGDTLTIILTENDGSSIVSDSVFTVVGIDNTVTSWDNIVFVKHSSLKFDDTVRGGTPVLYLNGNTEKFPSIREAIDADGRTVYKRSGFYPAEGMDRLDISLLISAFTGIVYAIAAVGLLNLILVTADDRRKEFDVLHLAGMTRGDAVRGILTETAILASAGTAVGLLFSLVANRTTTAFAQIVNKYVSPSLMPADILIIAAAACGIFAVCWAAAHIISFAMAASPRYRRREDRMIRSG